MVVLQLSATLAMQLPLPLVVVVLLAAGFLLSRIRFCMVAAVAEVRRGQFTTAQAITGIMASISAVLWLLSLGGSHATAQLLIQWRVVFGALLFGVAAAWNKGCFFGTSIQLGRGDANALWPMLGWLLGFHWLGQPTPLPRESTSPARIAVALLVLVLLWLLLQAANTSRHLSRAGSLAPPDWKASWLCGVLLGLLDNDLWHWDPSSLARALAHPTLLKQSLAQFGFTPLLGVVLLLGIALESVLTGQWRWRLPDWDQAVRLLYGVAMAMGAGLAMGGNDTQLLRYAPGGSPHGWLALVVMAGGIAIGLPRER